MRGTSGLCYWAGTQVGPDDDLRHANNAVTVIPFLLLPDRKVCIKNRFA